MSITLARPATSAARTVAATDRAQQVQVQGEEEIKPKSITSPRTIPPAR